MEVILGYIFKLLSMHWPNKLSRFEILWNNSITVFISKVPLYRGWIVQSHCAKTESSVWSGFFSVPGTAVNLKVTLYFYHSLRSKCFRSVSEQRKTEECDSQFWPREKWNKSQKMKVGRGEGRKRVSFLSSPPLLALLLAPFFARSLTLAPRSLFLNRTETLATQAIFIKSHYMLFDFDSLFSLTAAPKTAAKLA